jgi:hypothetical protein
MEIVLLRTAVIALATLAMHMGTAGEALARDDRQLWRWYGLYDVLFHYEIEGFDHRDNGVRLRSEVAQYICDSGNTDLGIDLLQRELSRARFAIPSTN